MDLIKIGIRRRQKQRPWNGRIQDNCVCVKPAVTRKDYWSVGVLKTPRERGDIHNPAGPLAVRLGHLLDDEAEYVSGLVEEAGFDDIMSQDMRGHSPLFPMLDMCIYASFVDGIKFLGLVYHGNLSQPGTAFIWIVGKVARDTILGNLGRGLGRWFWTRWDGIVGYGSWSGVLWGSGCGGIIGSPIGEGEGGARSW